MTVDWKVGIVVPGNGPVPEQLIQSVSFPLKFAFSDYSLSSLKLAMVGVFIPGKWVNTKLWTSVFQRASFSAH